MQKVWCWRRHIWQSKDKVISHSDFFPATFDLVKIVQLLYILLLFSYLGYLSNYKSIKLIGFDPIEINLVQLKFFIKCFINNIHHGPCLASAG